MSSTLLTKSKYLVGLQCPKLLWITFNNPKLLPPVDSKTQQLFDQGHEVGILAQKLYPKGILLQTQDFSKNLKETKELINKRKPLFEAAFLINNLYARTDILNPVNKDEWDIIEVKSSTSVKDVNLHDVSFQKYVLEQAGLKIRKCHLIHINNEYVKKGKINPKQLFKTQDITAEVEKTIVGIQDRIKAMQEIIALNTCPEINIGKICKDPYECSLIEQCWKHLPKNNVFDLYGKNKAEELMQKGILAIKDIPENIELTEKQQIQRNVEQTGKPRINKEQIKQFLQTLQYPLYFMDFETFQTAIPLYKGTRPYQQIPFQFSIHKIKKEETTPKHKQFLATGNKDPRKEFTSELKKAIGKKGTIITFNAGFEKARLTELAQTNTKHKEWIQNALDRITDLLTPFRNFDYYNTKQQGSASIKCVMPALTGKGYEDLEIAEGESASQTYLNLTLNKIPEKDKQKLRTNLEKYCERDTEGMIWILDELKKLTN